MARRPETGLRELIEEATLDEIEGLVGDNWRRRGSRRTEDGSAHPEMQLTIMNARVIDLITEDKSQWPLAGDQFYVDFDLSDEHLPPGTLLALGTAVVEVTAVPHLGCAKFTQRFGRPAMEFVNSDLGKALNLRGVNARVRRPGTVRCGDAIEKLDPATA